MVLMSWSASNTLDRCTRGRRILDRHSYFPHFSYALGAMAVWALVLGSWITQCSDFLQEMSEALCSLALTQLLLRAACKNDRLLIN